MGKLVLRIAIVILMVTVAVEFSGMSTVALEAAEPAAPCCDHEESGSRPAPPCPVPDCPKHPGVFVTLEEPIHLLVYFDEYPLAPSSADTPPDIFPDALFRPPKALGRDS